MSVLRTYTRLFRPATLIPLIFGTMVFGPVSVSRILSINDWLLLLLGGVLLSIGNGASNILNQLSDVVEDSHHPVKKNRPIVSGEVDPSVAMSLVLFIWIGATLVSVWFMPTVFSILYILVLLFAVAYSYPPRLKKYLGINNLSIATPRGGLGVAAAWVILGSIYDPRLWIVLLITVPFIFMANTAKDIDDAKADQTAGVRTFVNVFGEYYSRLLVAAGFMWPFFMVVAFGLWTTNLYLLIVSSFLLASSVLAAMRMKGSSLWLYFYASYGLLAVSYGLPRLIAQFQAVPFHF